MVAQVSIRNVRRIRWDSAHAEERIEVSGAIAIVGGRQTAWPAGSLQLRTVSEIVLTSKTPRRGIWGSVSSPSTLGNTILLVPHFLGTTGTRLASLAIIGSSPASGTMSAAFTAYGF